MASKNVRITTLSSLPPPSLPHPFSPCSSNHTSPRRVGEEEKGKEKNVFATITNFADVNAFLVDSISTLPQEIVKWKERERER